MTYCVSTATMRDSDAATIAAGVASTELMRRAAQGVFDRVEWRGRIAILCGKGNNGGDGLALAGILIERGFRPQVYLYAACSLSADAAYYREKLARIRYADVYDLQQWDGKADIVVDCLLGTGFRGEVRGDLRAAIETVNASGAYVVSVDIPSGLNGDSGRAPCAVRASNGCDRGDQERVAVGRGQRLRRRIGCRADRDRDRRRADRDRRTRRRNGVVCAALRGFA